MKPTNPFIVRGYRGPEYFCDREKETQTIVDTLKNQGDILLTSARRMGKTEKEQQEIYAMGLLHDIGKIGVAESIINKNGRLNDEEFAQIKKHPVTGYEILKNVEELPGLATGARWHHERYDGKGYPDGKAGNDIPEEARIIAVADAYDAMTSNRAYSSIRPQEDVRREIERCRGSQFDPVIADVFLSMIDDDKQYQMREHPANDNKKTA